MQAKLVSSTKPNVILELTWDEAKALNKAVINDFAWDETGDPDLWQALYHVLEDVLETK